MLASSLAKTHQCVDSLESTHFSGRIFLSGTVLLQILQYNNSNNNDFIAVYLLGRYTRYTRSDILHLQLITIIIIVINIVTITKIPTYYL